MHICSFCLYGVYLYLISLSPSCLYSNSPSSLNSYCHHLNHFILDQVIPKLLGKIILNQPPKASPICLDCVLTPVSGVLLLPIEINHDDELVWKLKKSIKASTC